MKSLICPKCGGGLGAYQLCWVHILRNKVAGLNSENRSTSKNYEVAIVFKEPETKHGSSLLLPPALLSILASMSLSG